LLAVVGAATAPQVFVGGEKIGGSEALQAWLEKSGKRERAKAEV
jgi:glutaredoxin